MKFKINYEQLTRNKWRSIVEVKDDKNKLIGLLQLDAKTKIYTNVLLGFKRDMECYLIAANDKKEGD